MHALARDQPHIVGYRVARRDDHDSVEDAVRDLCAAFRQGKLPNSFDDDRYYNVRTMKAAGAK